MNDICNFIPPKDHYGNIVYYHFVYETGLKKLNQPFLFANYRLHLVAKGTGVLKTETEDYELKPGTLFFTFPYQSHEIEGSSNFAYLYITFSGAGITNLLDNLKIGADRSVYQDFDHLLEFWMTSIRRVTPANANVLTESVLMYSLSFINNTEQKGKSKHTDKFNYIIEYIDNNYTQPDISIKKIADIFFYSDKYFSSLFKKKMDVKFTDYVNSLRIQHSLKLIEEGITSISELASKCGYSDSFYFSKVFKKITGKSPTEYTKGDN